MATSSTDNNERLPYSREWKNSPEQGVDFNVEEKKVTELFEKELALDHKWLHKELSAVDQEKNNEFTSNEFESQLEQMSVGKSSTFSYVKDSPLVEQMGGLDNPEVLTVFTNMDNMFTRLMDSYLASHEEIDTSSLMSQEQFYLLRSSFVLSLIKGIQEETESDQSGGILWKVAGWIWGSFGLKNAEKAEDISLTKIAASFLGRMNKFPAKHVAQRLQLLTEGISDAYLSGKKPEISMNSKDLVSWFDGSMPQTELWQKVLLDTAPNSKSDEFLKQFGSVLSLDEDSIESLKGMADVDKINKLLTNNQMQKQSRWLYGTFESMLTPFKWMLRKDSAKDMLESWWLAGVANMFLGWIGYEGGLDNLHKNYLLEKVEDQIDENQKDAVAYAYRWVEQNLNNQDKYAIDTAFDTRLKSASINEKYPLYKHVPLNSQFLKDVLKDSLTSTQALPSIDLLEKYCPQCFTIEKWEDWQELATIDSSEFYKPAVLDNFVNSVSIKSFIEFINNFPPSKASMITNPQTLVSLWLAESMFAPGAARAFGDGVLAIWDGQYFDTAQQDVSDSGKEAVELPNGWTMNATPMMLEQVQGTWSLEYPGNYDKAAIEALRQQVPAPLEDYSNNANFIKFLFALEDQHKLPRGMLVGIAFVESEFKQGLTSDAWAKWMFQFMDKTAGGVTGRWWSWEYAEKVSKRFWFEGLKGVHIQENPVYGALAAALFCEESFSKPGRRIADAVYRYNAGPGNWEKRMNDPVSTWPKGVQDYVGMVQNVVDSFRAWKVVWRGWWRDSYPVLMQKFLALGVPLWQSNVPETMPPLQATTFEMAKASNFWKIKDPTLTFHNGANLSKVVGLNNVYRSARPTLESLMKMKEEKGIKTFVCLTSTLKTREPESYKYLAEQEGIDFIYVPMTASPSEMSQENFVKIAEAAKAGNMAFFCDHGADRTGYLGAMLRKYLFWWSPEQITEEMHAFNSKVHPSNASKYPLSWGWDPIKSFAKFQAAIDNQDPYGLGTSLKNW